MAKLVFLPIAEQIESGTYLIYDGACGAGGMLTVAEDTLQELAARHASGPGSHRALKSVCVRGGTRTRLLCAMSSRDPR